MIIELAPGIERKDLLFVAFNRVSILKSFKSGRNIIYVLCISKFRGWSNSSLRMDVCLDKSIKLSALIEILLSEHFVCTYGSLSNEKMRSCISLLLPLLIDIWYLRFGILTFWHFGISAFRHFGILTF
jgi:hypothetical protein